MADQTDKQKRGLLKDILKEMKGANERFEKIAQAEMDAAAEGKGAIAGGFARLGAQQKIAREYLLATQGTINKRSAFFKGMGLENVGKMLDVFMPGKKVEPDPELRKKFGLDKKADKEGRGGIGKIAKPLSLILRNVIETKKMVKTIEKSLTKASTPKGRYVFDPRMAGGGRYRDTVTNKLVSSKVAMKERTDALTAAIGADEQPLVKLKETVEVRFESVDSMLKKINDSLDQIKVMMAAAAASDIVDDLTDIDVDTPDRKRTGPSTRKRPGKFRRALRRIGVKGARALRYARTAAPGAAMTAAAVGSIALVTGGAAYMASGKAADEAKKPLKELERIYGLKVLYDSKGATVGYTVQGKKYGLDNLPQEYKDLIEAYGPGDKRNASARAAIERIKANPEKYRMLELGYKPKDAATAPTKPAAVAPTAPAGASAAGLTIPEPSMLPAPSTASVAGKAPSFTVAPSATSTPSAPSTSPVTTAVSAVKSTVQKAVSAGGQATMATGAAVGAAAKTGVEKVKDIIVGAAKRVGVNPGIMLAMGQQESSFNPSAQPYIKDKKTGERKLLSSAKGIFQFINSTWDAMVKKYSGQYPELLKGAFDPEANALAGALYVKENSDFLKRRSIPVTGTSIYATHFLGPGGAAKLFSAPKDALASDIMPGPAASNPHIFFDKGKPKTIQEVIDTLYKKVGSKAETFQAQVDSGKIGLSAPSQPMLASAPPAPKPSISPAPKTTGAEATQQSRQYDTNKMVASNAPAAAPVVINNNSNNKAPPQAPKQPMPMASTRPSESSFNRAISKDFAHPTAFTSAVVA